MSTDAVATEVEAALRAAGTPERAAKERAYLRSDLTHLGTTVPVIRRVAKAALPRSADPSRDEVLAVARSLWARPVHECRMAAVELLDLHGPLLRCDDALLIERLLRESRTWALVDGLAASVAGPLVERCPELAATLDRWATDGDFWLRRSALLAELLPLRRGGGDFDRFARHADAMLHEREFFVRKAIGWVLRETAKRRPELVFEWLLPRARRASGVTLREAVKPLPAEQRERILAARGTA
jgi:3-methyladenine DNA glycosylase AlkD